MGRFKKVLASAAAMMVAAGGVGSANAATYVCGVGASPCYFDGTSGGIDTTAVTTTTNDTYKFTTGSQGNFFINFGAIGVAITNVALGGVSGVADAFGTYTWFEPAGGTYDLTFTATKGGKGLHQFSATAGLLAVPEPAMWIMMIGGFALCGAALRRRRTSATEAFA